MQILDVYTGKEYECKICKKKVYYGKVANTKGELYTIDNKPPNGKFAKESNVLSCKVDLLVKDKIHSCDLKKITEKCKELDEFKEPQSIQNAQTNPNVQIAPSPLVREMSVTDFAEPAMRKEIQVHCKVLRIIEDEVSHFLGRETNPARVGMWMKMVYEMMEVKKK